jgi:tetratricopeptide (TPR) repeat protein
MSVQLPRSGLNFPLLAKLLVTATSAILPLSGASSIATVTPGASTVISLRTLFASGQVDAALEQVQTLLDASPGDAPLFTLLGDILFRQSKFSEAERAYRSAVDADGNYARGYWGLGRIELLASRRRAAREHIARAFQLDPRDPDIMLTFADFVQDARSRIILLRNFLSITGGGNADRARVEDVAARLEIAERLGRLDNARLASPYQAYRIKLAGYYPNGQTQTGLLMEVSLNGSKPLRLVLDSGADGIFVRGARARTLNLERLTNDRITGVGSPRDDRAYVALAHRVTAGDLELEDCLVHVSETSSFPNADGVIGMNLFEKFLVYVDAVSASLNLSPYTNGSNPGAASSRTVRAWRVGQLLLVNASIDGQGHCFLLDTGSSFSATPSAAPASNARDTGQAAEVNILGADGRVRGARRAQPLRLTFDGEEVVDENPVKLDLTELSRREGIEISGIIGYPALEKSGLTINYRDGLVLFGRPDR